LEEVLDRLSPTDPARGELIAACAGVEHLLGRHRRAHQRLSQAYRGSSNRSSAEAVALRIELASGGGFECRMTDMKKWAEDALAGAAALGRRTLEVAAAGQVALADYFLGLPTVGAAMDHAAAVFDGLSDAELAERLDVGICVGW